MNDLILFIQIYFSLIIIKFIGSIGFYLYFKEAMHPDMFTLGMFIMTFFIWLVIRD